MNFNFSRFFSKYDLSNASPGLTQQVLKKFNQNRPLGPQEKVCYAPFKSIYFAHYGKAIACCWNRSHALGYYPKNSVHEIWFGKEAEKLRGHIDDYNLEHGCQGCKSHILAGSYDVAKAKQYDHNKLNSNKYPSVMEFELSNTCNLECEMCSGDFSSLIRKNREGRPPLKEPYDDTFVEQLEEFIPHLEEVKFYGGEPFLVEIYYQIWKKIIDINPSVRINVQTNATILNNRVKTVLNKANFHLGLSIDSFEKENYERIRKNARFETTMENIGWFRDYCKERGTYFGIAACAMQQNWHELADFVRKCNELEATVSLHTVYFPERCSFHSLGLDKLRPMIKSMESEVLPSNTELEKTNKAQFDDVIKQLRHLSAEITRQEKEESHNELSKKIILQSIQDIEAFLVKFIKENKGWSTSIKQAKTDSTLKKLAELEAILGKEYDYREALSDFDFRSDYMNHRFLNEIETRPVADLVSLITKSNNK